MVLGEFRRDVTRLTTGETLEDSWYSAEAAIAGEQVLVTIDSIDPAQVQALRPRAEGLVRAAPALTRAASDAVAHEFTTGVPAPADLDEAAADLRLSTIELFPDASAVLHLTDTCGKHFLDGYWPAVRLSATDEVVDVSVEA